MKNLLWNVAMAALTISFEMHNTVNSFDSPKKVDFSLCSRQVRTEFEGDRVVVFFYTSSKSVWKCPRPKLVIYGYISSWSSSSLHDQWLDVKSTCDDVGRFKIWCYKANFVAYDQKYLSCALYILCRLVSFCPYLKTDQT